MRSGADAVSLPVEPGPEASAPAVADPLRPREQSARPAGRRRLLYLLNAFDRGGAELGLLFLARKGFFSPFDARAVAICRGQDDLEGDLADTGLPAEALFETARMTAKHMALALPRLVGLLRRERPEVLVLSLPQANIVGRLAAALAGVPLVVSFEHNTRLSRRLFELLYRLLSPCVTVMFADCRRTAEEARQRFYPGRRLTEYIVPLCAFSRATPARRPDPASLAHRLRIVSVGRLTRTKNHRCLIEAVALLAIRGIDVEAEIFGTGPMQPELKALAYDLGVDKLVHFRGFVARWWEHSDANLFVLTSRHEGLCIVVLEAMWAGIPVIAPRTGGIIDYGSDDNMALLADLEPATLAAHLEAVMAAPEQAARRVDAGQQTVAEGFSEDVVARRVRDVSHHLAALPIRRQR